MMIRIESCVGTLPISLTRRIQWPPSVTEAEHLHLSKWPLRRQDREFGQGTQPK
jgi:hypothetical protein